MQPHSINALINDYTHSNARHFINCSGLFKAHNPKTLDQWCQVVQAQSHNLDSIAAHAFAHQGTAGCSYSYQRLYDWLYELIILKTFVGFNKELKALKELKSLHPNLLLGIDERYDGDYGVDIYVGATTPVRYMAGGIQVKPISYLDLPAEAKQLNITKNEKYKSKFPNVHEIKYLYYNKNGSWYNMDEVEDYLAELAFLNEHSRYAPAA